MTLVNFQFDRRRVSVLADTLVTRGDRPWSWAAKVLVLPAQWIVVVARGPDDYRHDLGRELEHVPLPAGLDSAVHVIPHMLADTRAKVGDDGHVWTVGWSKAKGGFAGWRFISPEFEPEALPEGLHAAPGPADAPHYHRPSLEPQAKLIELAKLQKRLVAEDNGHESIGGDLVEIRMTAAEGMAIQKIHRFDDFDALAAQMLGDGRGRAGRDDAGGPRADRAGGERHEHEGRDKAVP